jgi:hypothetical protein
MGENRISTDDDEGTVPLHPDDIFYVIANL